MTPLTDRSTLPDSQLPYREYIDRLSAIMEAQMMPWHGTLYTDDASAEAVTELCRAVAPDDPAAFCVAVDAVMPMYAVGTDDDVTLEESLNALVLSAPLVI